MDRVFLDANVLFSAAYRSGSPLMGLWELAEAEILSCELAFEEARRNLAARAPDRLSALDDLRPATQVVGAAAGPPHLPADVDLPENDQQILAAAIAAGCTHLLTGDRRHFGALYGRPIGGVLVLRPGEYLRGRRTASLSCPR